MTKSSTLTWTRGRQTYGQCRRSKACAVIFKVIFVADSIVSSITKYMGSE